MKKKWLMNRRDALKGIGVSLGLPLLECMIPSLTFGQSAGRPKRFIALFTGNGQITSSWTPQATLKPLYDLGVQSKASIITGTDHRPGGNQHYSGTSGFLSATEAREGTQYVGKSLDQVLVDNVLPGAASKTFRSLDLGAYDWSAVDPGYSPRYLDRISWRTPIQPSPRYNNAASVFNSLSSNIPQVNPVPDPELAPKQGIMSLVKDDANALMSRLGSADRIKLEEYLAGVEGIETRLDAQAVIAAQPVQSSCGDGFVAPGSFDINSGNGHKNHMEAMIENIVLSFKCDLTQSATLMLGNGVDYLQYRDIVTPLYDEYGLMEYHRTSHGTSSSYVNNLKAIDQHNMRLVAYLIKRLNESTNPDGTSLLDETVIIYGNEMASGSSHTGQGMNVLVAGGGNTLKLGQSFNANGTRLANLYVTLLKAMGSTGTTSFGNSNGNMDFLLR